MFIWCPEGDLNPHDRLRSADFKSAVSADFTIRAPRAIEASLAHLSVLAHHAPRMENQRAQEMRTQLANR
jgi:hypothetical protein